MENINHKSRKLLCFALAVFVLSVLHGRRNLVIASDSVSDISVTDSVFVGTAVSEGIEMNYCRFGNGSKVFIILPGLSVKPVTASAEAVAQGFADFTQDYTVYLFDRRSNIPETYSIDDMAEDTVQIIKSLGIEKADFFGASQGGMILQSIAIKHPEMTGKIVLGSTASRINDTLEAVVSRWIELAKSGNGYELNRSFCETIYAPAVFEAYKDVLLASGNDITAEELERFVILASSINSLRLYDELDRIKSETLVLGCEGDRVTTPEAAAEIAEKLDCSSWFYSSEYGHAVFDEAPDYRQRMLKFLRGEKIKRNTYHYCLQD